MLLETQQRVAAAFNRAANSYDETAQMQQRYAMDLIMQARVICHPRRIIDLGCGTGYNFKSIRQTFPDVELIGLDCAYDMLRFAQPRVGEKNYLIQADMDCLPFVTGSCDLLLCHFALQWSEDLNVTLKSFNQLLSSDGCVSIATFGSGTLNELAEVTRVVTGQSSVNTFVSQDELVTLLAMNGFSIEKQRVVIETLYMTEVIQLMDYLKTIGGNTVLQAQQQRGLGGKQRLRDYQIAYQSFADDRGKLPATFEIILVIARKR